MEEKNKNNNRKLLLTITGVLLLVALVIGITYAAWTYTFNGTKVSSLSTADIKLELLESDDNIITINNALPMSDNEGKAQTTYFDFVVTSKTVRDIDVDYTISLEKLTADTGYTLLSDNQIKVYLTDTSNTQIVAPTLVSNLTDYKLYSSSHSHDSSHNKAQSKYRLRVWIDSEVDASNWNASTKLEYKFRIGVTGGEERYLYRNHQIFDAQHLYIGENVNQYCATSLTSLQFDDDIDSYYNSCNRDFEVLNIYYTFNTQNECESVVSQVAPTFGCSASDFTCQTLSESFGLTNSYTSINRNVFNRVAIADGEIIRTDVCFVRNNTLYCLKGVEVANAGYNAQNPAPYYEENQNTLLEAFGPNAVANNVCSVDASGINCSASGFDAYAFVSGSVNVYGGSLNCDSSSSGDSKCY